MFSAEPVEIKVSQVRWISYDNNQPTLTSEMVCFLYFTDYVALPPSPPGLRLAHHPIKTFSMFLTNFLIRGSCSVGY